ncbi:extracellular solute-binding protein [Streptomyces indicus]|uniref:Raffinose/stachyose/melibiose transport system substrate-binding protein n=1 Tax=Streptomyces indicus TaxID=417292 RepID=A0A1G8TDA5_9ACTN|nr:extracellular solute-binding protein [Streptomyces indicus]SDJ39384.1 raffinose/stachyose/melibiose transport system substrate-binding protein [Streptomyces indicus]
MLKARRRARLLAAALAGILSMSTLAACGDDAGGGGDGKTLRLWHYEAPESAMGKAWNEAIAEFKKKNPDVKVEFEAKGFEQIQKTAPQVLNSDEAPDLLEYNKGNATTGQLSKQGLLTDLSTVAKERGWDKAIPPTVAVTSRYNKGVMGSGPWYGVPNYAEYTLVYYNKDLFAEHGVEVPTTVDELEQALATFKEAGLTPFANGGAEYVAQQYVYQLALSQADRSWVESFQMKGATDFSDAAWTYAAETFADWVDKGYIAKSSSGVKAEDAGVSFMQGKHPLFFSGSWWFGRFGTEIKKFDWDTFMWPGSKMTLGSGGNLWVVPEGAKNKELAYDFIDITMQKGIQNTLGNAGGVPVAADPSGITDARSKKLIEQFDSLAGNDGLAFYPDWPANGFYDSLTSEVQKLITQSAEPADVLKALQAEYDENVLK